VVKVEDLRRGELIGLEARVTMSSSRALVGMRGKIIDETKNILVLRTAGGDKKIPKITSAFLITLPNGKEVKVNGTQILGRPEDRIRKLR
jgi:ribonuclease P protein subunit POP4